MFVIVHIDSIARMWTSVNDRVWISRYTIDVDCFVTSNLARPYFKKLTLKALSVQKPTLHPKLVVAPMLIRYFECERRATTPLYVLCDDDCVPATEDTMHKLEEIMKVHPEYSQLGLGWKANMKDEESNGWILNRGPTIWEMFAVGGCMIIRKGTIKDLGIKPEFESGYGDDRVMGETARRLGYKVGIVPSLYFHHLGAQFTTFKN